MSLGIHCCEKCVPPKRKIGCHSDCPDYLKAKAKYEEDKKKEKELINPLVYRSQFVGNAKKRKKSKRPAV